MGQFSVKISAPEGQFSVELNNFGTTCYRIPCRIRPFNWCLVGHERSSANV
jgi:hypothetical protein